MNNNKINYKMNFDITEKPKGSFTLSQVIYVENKIISGIKIKIIKKNFKKKFSEKLTNKMLKNLRYFPK